MESNFSRSSTHCWIGRRLGLLPRQALIQRVCTDCGRAFVDECSTGARYAVHVSIFKLDRLSDDVTCKWLSETCPAQRLAYDEADRQTRFIAKAVTEAIPASHAITADALDALRNTE